MNIKWMTFFSTAVICLASSGGLAEAQVGQYYDGYDSSVSYGSTVTYQSPVIESQQYQSPTYYPEQVAYQSFDSGQIVYSDHQQPIQGSVSPVPTTAYSGNSYTSTNPQPGLAQQKATQAAQMSYRNHIGGGLGGANFEGVGWSNQSAQTAIQNCCYWGQRAPAQIGVSKSPDGCWYACVLYH